MGRGYAEPVDPAVEERIRRAYAAFAAGDFDAAMASFAPDVQLVNPDYAMEAGVREGLDSLREGLQSLHDQFEYDSLEILEIDEGPSGVLVVARLEGVRPRERSADRRDLHARVRAARRAGRELPLVPHARGGPRGGGAQLIP